MKMVLYYNSYGSYFIFPDTIRRPKYWTTTFSESCGFVVVGLPLLLSSKDVVVDSYRRHHRPCLFSENLAAGTVVPLILPGVAERIAISLTGASRCYASDLIVQT